MDIQMPLMVLATAGMINPQSFEKRIYTYIWFCKLKFIVTKGVQ